ncbi:NaeI family type II restriction endonuclease [Actinacidiphila bryophytorum]|uniref:Type-2 restriction enzyme NaeI n=1 Tax=Actinacidiphila bryophytorum TaxID=1436133 RepID=A0A9W4MFB4_9ACTN|nr:NaeI family type II restriction endonuclease [Actinacidiphila bryophytorum]MBM9434973.1 NaeI family type II restriction endonuclease [Actinacidiphila bryophytorum]MBN6547489.1 NaeI family type II restriction endonuclease [Actinacidiphila bryophytorum]CAG7641936.1 Type-2 restriction enzyme NaeI [Actinacidiphila bryophytorum]
MKLGASLLPFEDDVVAARNIQAAAEIEADSELMIVRDRLLLLDPDGKRFGRVIRETFDQLLSGETTGRYAWEQLRQTEKTHAGSMVEINLHREFDFDDGSDMDYRIEDIEVDCKYSQDFGGWMIPPEAMGHLCLLLCADDSTSTWSGGLIRISEEILNAGKNRDGKRSIKAASRRNICWLWRNSELPENLLLHLDAATREQILLPGRNKGQKRVNQLFRLVHSRRISRSVVRTVAQQYDYMARVREGDRGRARPKLREEGIIILGDYLSHQAVAQALGGPVPGAGEFVAFKIAPAGPQHAGLPQAELDGRYWVVVEPSAQVGPAPRIPEPQGRKEA